MLRMLESMRHIEEVDDNDDVEEDYYNYDDDNEEDNGDGPNHFIPSFTHDKFQRSSSDSIEPTLEHPLPYAPCYFENWKAVMKLVDDSRLDYSISGKDGESSKSSSSDCGRDDVKVDIISILDAASERELVLSSLELAFFDLHENLSEIMWYNSMKSESFVS
jgi:hypothetical protein